jgi:hypothetical protein
MLLSQEQENGHARILRSVGRIGKPRAIPSQSHMTSVAVTITQPKVP